MPDKSYVTMETVICIVCGQEKESGALLLDQKLRPKFNQKTCTGWGLCDEHQKLKDKGFIALVGIDPEKTTENTPDQWYRIGAFAHLKETAFKRIMNVPVPSGKICCVDQEVFDMLEKMQENAV